ncbi:universal stress protein [Streptomyces sp. NPDC059786]|uniref:universal stress protein n=1 Tax=Streptomyces sp. NPDC059786 TaxID=3346946 RepID=UPI0036526680
MEQVILVCADASARGRSAADWAEREARLRDLPLRVLPDPPRDTSAAGTIVCAVPREAAAAGRPAGRALPAAVRTCDRPVVLVPDDVPAPARRAGNVVLAVDARRPSDGAIDFAFDTARVHGAPLRAVHAWSLPAAAAEWPFGVPEEERAAWEDHEVQLLADALRPWREKYPDVPVLEDVVLFTPAEALLHHAGRASLIVVGRGPDPGRDEVVRDLLAEAACPVAVVPARLRK